ncbi:uncharacterized protein Tco025E_09893, partial [Trypanosoma conorhini]
NTDGKLRWRVAGGQPSTWKECPQAVTGAGSSEIAAAVAHTLCLVAGSVYLGGFPAGKCSSPPTEGGGAAAFTLSCKVTANSALHNLSKGETVAINETEDPLGASGDCASPTSSPPAAEVRSLPQPQNPQAPAGPQAPPQSLPQQLPPPPAPVKTEHGDNPSGVSRSVPKEPTAPAGLPGTVAGLTGSRESSAEGRRETPTPSVDTAASPTQTANGAAEGPGSTPTPSTPQGRSATPNAAPPAGGSNATTTTAAITRSPSAANDAKSNADSTATNTLFVRASPMLLLTAALAAAAG